MRTSPRWRLRARIRVDSRPSAHLSGRGPRASRRADRERRPASRTTSCSSLIGRDGATEIFRARDTRLERDVAVKLLRPEEMARPGALERFRSEARTAVARHPSAHLRGPRLRRGGRAAVPRLRVARGPRARRARRGMPLPPIACSTSGSRSPTRSPPPIAAAIVHGTLKPSNVFITTDGHVKLLELGARRARCPPHRPPRRPPSPTSSIQLARGAATPGEFLQRLHSPEQVSGPGDHRERHLRGRRVAVRDGDRRARVPGRHSGGDRRRDRRAACRRSRAASTRRSRGSSSRSSLARWRRTPGRRYQTGAALLEDLRRARRARSHAAAGPVAARPARFSRRHRAVSIVLIRWRAGPLVVARGPRRPSAQSRPGQPDRQWHRGARFRRHAARGDHGVSRAVAVSRPRVGRAVRGTLRLMGRDPTRG